MLQVNVGTNTWSACTDGAYHVKYVTQAVWCGCTQVARNALPPPFTPNVWGYSQRLTVFDAADTLQRWVADWIMILSGGILQEDHVSLVSEAPHGKQHAEPETVAELMTNWNGNLTTNDQLTQPKACCKSN